ncbi:MAG: beta-lactamase family protein [Ferruginibacter sp.]|nr:beta-lactamase family protein [Ferruginibacter sp.]
MRKKSFYKSGLLLLLLFISTGSPALFSQEIKYAEEVEKRISQVEKTLASRLKAADTVNWTLQERMNFYNANGVSIAVISNYGIEWARGYGWADKSEFRPVTTTTLFQAGSISKSINGIGILKLVQDGRLNLYTDINEYLQTWKFPYDSLSKGKKISAANLLSHTAGLSVHGFPGYANGAVLPTLPQILDGNRPANTAAVRSLFEPSLKAQYSGGGTTIAQLMIADITGEPYDVFMWKNILEPMGMTNSFYTQPPLKEKQNLVATAYYNNGKEVKGKYHIYPEQAAAGLWTNPTDLAKYIIETQLSSQGRSDKVLSNEMTNIRLTPFIDSTSALGVFIIKRGGEKYFTHGGVDEGFVSQYYGSVEGGNGVVVMANTYNTAILVEIVNSVAAVYKWKDFLPAR